MCAHVPCCIQEPNETEPRGNDARRRTATRARRDDATRRDARIKRTVAHRPTRGHRVRCAEDDANARRRCRCRRARNRHTRRDERAR
jgi:hypothetical protein